MTLLPKQSRGTGNSIAKRLFSEKVGTRRRYKISRIDEIIQAPAMTCSFAMRLIVKTSKVSKTFLVLTTGATIKARRLGRKIF